jgi:hypothetical protein
VVGLSRAAKSAASAAAVIVAGYIWGRHRSQADEETVEIDDSVPLVTGETAGWRSRVMQAIRNAKWLPDDS